MKHGLNRIEPNLYKLETGNIATNPQPKVLKRRAYSFEIRRATQEYHGTEKATAAAPTQTNTGVGKIPTLPQFNFNLDRSDRQDVNPSSEINQVLVTKIDVATCETQLRQIVHQIEQIYMEGPIVDGWLEFNHPEPAATSFNSVSVDSIGEPADCTAPTEIDESCISYRLSGLDAAGNKWSYPCPLEQLPSVSMAIARYHKLQQLLQQKQYFETCLRTSE